MSRVFLLEGLLSLFKLAAASFELSFGLFRAGSAYLWVYWLLQAVFYLGRQLVAEDAKLLGLQVGEVRSRLLALDVSRDLEEAASFCLVAQVVGFEKEFAVDHVFAIIINNGNGTNVDLIIHG